MYGMLNPAFGVQKRLRRRWHLQERERMDALQRVWQQREAAHRAASEAEQAKARDALAADCRQAREVRHALMPVIKVCKLRFLLW